MKKTRCPECQFRIPVGAKRCGRCGAVFDAPLEAGPPEPSFGRALLVAVLLVVGLVVAAVLLSLVSDLWDKQPQLAAILVGFPATIAIGIYILMWEEKRKRTAKQQPKSNQPHKRGDLH
jgi:uncharacterized membrane protein YcjF (UPF0283 family)